ncbi:hypothetical protein RBB50_007738 [Rhinocladiella similis]|uniref:Uncharacterized protein n=1 Tax=Exophiala oligosperma TaxID=215243 RepID=A0A0D2A664_9EURO|nr:uncharacterized protein PV06_11818 [Exophiala oligosperma]KIW35856.1 hypothetical protein PV06_11818 [Exophiala oligosperma]
MRYDFDLGYLLENMPWFLQLPLLEEMNVWINARSLATLIPRTNNTGLGEGRNGYCSRHKGYIGKSQVFHEMAEFRDGVADLLDGGPHLAFRFHMTQKALLRTHDRVTRDHPSLRARHHEDFEKRPTFKACIDGLKDYYAVFVIPWHITDLKLVHGSL